MDLVRRGMSTYFKFLTCDMSTQNSVIAKEIVFACKDRPVLAILTCRGRCMHALKAFVQHVLSS